METKVRGTVLNDSIPLKAYRISWYGDFCGLFVGRTPGQAKAAFARSTWTDGVTDSNSIWANIRCQRCPDQEAELLAIEDHEDQYKYWKDKRRTARLQAAADAFNRKYPVGTPVRILPYVGTLANPVDTTTRTPAWVPNECQVLVSVTGHAGGFQLKDIQPLVLSIQTS